KDGGEDDGSGSEQGKQPRGVERWKVISGEARQRPAHKPACRNADRSDRHTVEQHARKNTARPGAESEPDSKLARAPAHRKSQHAGNPAHANHHAPPPAPPHPPPIPPLLPPHP